MSDGVYVSRLQLVVSLSISQLTIERIDQYPSTQLLGIINHIEGNYQSLIPLGIVSRAKPPALITKHIRIDHLQSLNGNSDEIRVVYIDSTSH